jgi:hypothetical protein
MIFAELTFTAKTFTAKTFAGKTFAAGQAYIASRRPRIAAG